MRKLCLSFLAAALILGISAPVAAVPPTGAERPLEEKKPPVRPDFVRTTQGETSITGIVRDQNRKPLKDVSVKLFVEGLLVASALTDGQGAYKMKYAIDIGKDKTVMLWYVSKEPQWVPKAVVLHESKSAQSSRLISSCIPRVQVQPFLEFNVQMVDVSTRNRQLAQSDCFAGTQTSK